MPHEHDWVTPSPLWGPQGYRQAEFFQPAIFEYRSDDFMEGFLAAAAAKNPATLAGARLLAPANGQPNSLYLPSHGCFYLAAASLVCRLPGFPERLVRRSEGERVGFALRKLVNGTEYGWVVTQESRGWQAMNATAFDATDGVGRALLKHEELLPVFPVPSSDGRQVYGGYIPVSSSETYKAPPAELVVKTKTGMTKH